MPCDEWTSSVQKPYKFESIPTCSIIMHSEKDDNDYGGITARAPREDDIKRRRLEEQKLSLWKHGDGYE